MIIRLILLVACMATILIVVHKIKTAHPKKRFSLIATYVLYVFIGLVVVAFFTGRLHWIGAIAAAILGLLRFGAHRLFRALPAFNFLRRQHFFANPQFSTRYLQVTIDINTGKIDANIICGDYAGKKIAQLSEQELHAFENTLRHNDTKSYYLLRLVKQKMAAHNTAEDNTQHNNVQAPRDDTMTVEEAQKILGVNANTSKKDIDRAYKRLIQKFHPDRGGNDYLAARINLARDLLNKYANP